MTATTRESGHYALAGFLYQLIGSGVEAFAIAEGPEDNNTPDRLLLLECFGQDAVAIPCDGSRKRPKLIQYKYSSTGHQITPSELRTILESLLKSVRCQEFAIDHVEYSLVTNRRYSPGADKWVTAMAEADEELERLIRASSNEPVDDVAELASIFRLLKYDTRTLAAFKDAIFGAARQFGILDDEIDARVHQLVGFLLERASRSGSRIVHPKELHKAFTGYDSPYRLLSPESVQVRLDDVEQYKRDETGRKPTIPRTASDDIFRSVLEYPLTVVVGDGGAGKTVAACDAVVRGLLETSTPPGFGLIVRAPDANSQTLIEKIARWRHRNRSHPGDRSSEN